METESGGRLRRLAQAASRQHLTLAGSVGGAVVLAVLVAGGFDPDRQTVEVAPLEVGETVDIGPLTITVDRMRVVDELPGVSEGNDDTRVLALVATVAATGTKTEYGVMLTQSVALDGVPGVPALYEPAEPDEAVPAENALVMADGTRLDALQPGLEYEVALVWEQAADAEVPSSAKLVLVGHTLRRSSIDHTQEWLDPVPIVAGDIEVRPPDPDAEPTEAGS